MVGIAGAREERSRLAFPVTGRPQATVAAPRQDDRRQEKTADDSSDKLPPISWSAAHTVDQAQLKRALSAMDDFPRSVLLLSVFERVPVDLVASLLGASRKLIRTTIATAAVELACRVAKEQGWDAAATSAQDPATASL